MKKSQKNTQIRRHEPRKKPVVVLKKKKSGSNGPVRSTPNGRQYQQFEFPSRGQTGSSERSQTSKHS